MKNKSLLLCALFALLPLLNGVAQIKLGDETYLTGSFQMDNLVENDKDGSGLDFMNNTYLNLNLTSKNVFAGLRLDLTEWPLPGYENDFKGWGLGNIFVTWKYKNLELTGGSIYDQFGSGFILRTYEERNLGIDNSLMGGRIKYSPYKGVDLKVLGGTQKAYYDYNSGFVFGADAEFSLDQWIKSFQDNNIYWSVGASWVTKHESDEDVFYTVSEEINPGETVTSKYRLNLPENVGAFDIRTRFQKDNVSVLLEHAIKANDPGFENSYIYHKGQATMLSLTYSKRGITGMLQAKRSDNMAFRSKRSMQGTSSFINHLPAFSQQHTYALAALYPYATQPDGEWAFQGEFSYNFKKGTALGGKYGTTVRLNASHIRDIDREYKEGTGHKGRDEYKSSFFKWGDETFYQDINIDIDKKITKDFKLNLMYMNQRYNPVVQGHDEGMITSNIFIAEGKYNINKKLTLRAEAQYLHASDYDGDESVPVKDRSNQGDWLFGLLELSIAPGWMFSVQDNYNVGDTDEHYYMLSGVWNYKTHRVQVGYGRTRAGYDCSGGVCRMVPQTHGVRLNYSFTF
jgi:hypothetical protein